VQEDWMVLSEMFCLYVYMMGEWFVWHECCPTPVSQPFLVKIFFWFLICSAQFFALFSTEAWKLPNVNDKLLEEEKSSPLSKLFQQCLEIASLNRSRAFLFNVSSGQLYIRFQYVTQKTEILLRSWFWTKT